MGSEYVGLAFVTELDGDKVEAPALPPPRGRWLVGRPPHRAGRLARDRVEHRAVLRAASPRRPLGRSAAVFVSYLDQGATEQRVTIVGVGPPPFG